ncbi:hypothetical protein PRUPE_2G172600 [Prunus persica]|uniref:Uncharacterized protein n=1 Tax=Prunus persica TaxID=3760 RepID=A0A251QHE6_PRUPE|nr:hypothetical protein PRUPE_2G172600 [Prunus persica]
MARSPSTPFLYSSLCKFKNQNFIFHLQSQLSLFHLQKQHQSKSCFIPTKFSNVTDLLSFLVTFLLSDNKEKFLMLGSEAFRFKELYTL